MTTVYKTMTINEAIKQRVPGADEWSDWRADYELDLMSCIVEYENQTPLRIVGTDGGEPEDNSLIRDWSWVAGELNQSYHKGYTDGVRADNR